MTLTQEKENDWKETSDLKFSDLQDYWAVQEF